MTTRFVRSLTALSLAGSLLPVAIAGAQRATTEHATAIELTPYAGYMMFGKYIDGPIGTSIKSANSPIYGAELGLSLSRNIAIVGNVGYSSSDLEVGVPILGGLSVGTTKALVYDGGLRFKLPMAGANGSSITPFVQAGVGAMHYDIQTSIVDTKATNTAFNFCGGLDFRLSASLGLQLMAKDYVG
jgi:hypothetical protein